MSKAWTVSWHLGDEYQIVFKTKDPHKDIAWVFAPHHASFPREKVFKYVEEQEKHFEPEDIFEIDGEKLVGFKALMAHLRNKQL